MSTNEWKERIQRFQGNDVLITLLVIVVVLALVAHEGIVYTRATTGAATTEGPAGRILLGILTAFTYFKSRQTHKDVIQDVGATTELREKVEQEVAPAIRDTNARLESDSQQMCSALVVQHNAAMQKMIEDRRVERHDYQGRLQAVELLKTETEHENRLLQQRVGMLEGMLAAKATETPKGT